MRERIAQRSCSTLEAEKKQFETQVREKQRRHDEIDKKGHTQTAHGSDLEKLQEQSCCFLLWRGEVSADVVASLKGIGEPLALFHTEELPSFIALGSEGRTGEAGSQRRCPPEFGTCNELFTLNGSKCASHTGSRFEPTRRAVVKRPDRAQPSFRG